MTNITNKTLLDQAIQAAFEFADTVIIQRYITGEEYRVVVIGDAVIVAIERTPPSVIGDGTHTVQELIDIENGSEARGGGYEKSLTKIPIDAELVNFIKLQ